MDTEEPRTWEVEAGVSIFDGKPFVNIWSGEHSIQLRPREALMLGIQLMDSALEAERDAGLVAYLQGMNWSLEEAATVMKGVRENRESAIHGLLDIFNKENESG